ncbi:5-bromo-4-chloroindolyl phosphate hydrolase [Thiocapsa imhoffii]|uniref:5-bromo-4-chloroindolyl phosphate hydrolase n=1 Tax=Thiocapsa imhoffii TaxID=382777 RepID=A0A9X0WJ26_9GAMM|nr:5-bromo-4-chloroindolyl phosphate hydrolysis family protein [Thiocapsa imhoffii]MBK1645646.1 5-bromo-4-chloroindolyl phosphate hydrolase [Thiocapsa imhoffii]
MGAPTNLPPEQRRTLGLGELLFGGKPVLGGQAPLRMRPRAKGTLLYLLPVPLLIAALVGLGAGRLEVALIAGGLFGLFMLGADLTRRGLKAEVADQTLRFARLRPAPLKTLGGLLIGLATGLMASWVVVLGLGLSLAYAGVAMLGFHFVYGFESWGRQRVVASDDERTRKIVAALAEAERQLLDLEQAAARIANRELKQRLARIGVQGRAILDQIAERPTDLFRARKFLNVYLDGVKQVADGYARTHRLADSRELEQNFRNVLITVEQAFEEQHQRLLKTDLMDLDVQIEVLKKQLEREGVR